MQFCFADDARQNNPSRPGMGALVAIGGIQVPCEVVREFEKQIHQMCDECGFPPGEEFKWSPGRDLWMHSNLTGPDREDFFIRVLTLAQDNGVNVIVVVEDTGYKTATDARSPEEDVTNLFLERVHHQLGSAQADGIVVVDRPGGSRADEDEFLGACLETVQAGTRYVRPDRIALNVLSTPSKLVRLLQVADVVTSCTLAHVGGESRYSPPIFESIRPMLPEDRGRTGGVGLKLHPDYVYANLYYWLLGDEYLISKGTGHPLPLVDRKYGAGPNTPSE